MSEPRKLDWKDKPTMEPGNGPQPGGIPSEAPDQGEKDPQDFIPEVAESGPIEPALAPDPKEQQIKIAQALGVICNVVGLTPAEVQRAIEGAIFARNKKPQAVPLLDADAYMGPLYSARNKIDQSVLWAIRLPIITKKTMKLKDKEGIVYGKPGDYLVHIPGNEDLMIIPSYNFEGIYNWIPASAWPEHICLTDKVLSKEVSRLKKAKKLELDPSSRDLVKYAKLFEEAWAVQVAAMYVDGKLAVKAPDAQAENITIIQPSNPPEEPQYAYTLSRFNNGYMMLVDLEGSQFPLIQGKVVEAVPRILDLIRNLENLETFGDFAYSAKGADNFVKSYMNHGYHVLNPMMKDQWKFGYYLLAKHTEFLNHPERMADDKPQTTIPRVERRRFDRSKQPTNAMRAVLDAKALEEAEKAKAKEISEGDSSDIIKDTE